MKPNGITTPTFEAHSSKTNGHTGYTIRLAVMENVLTHLWNDYNAKMGQYEISMKKEGDELVTDVKLPDIPGTDMILQTAEQFYGFINNHQKK